MKNFDYLEPITVAEACVLLKQHGGDAKVYAGGAYLGIVLKQGLLEPKALVNIKKIDALKGIRYDDRDGLIIGSLVTHRELETSAVAKEMFPVLCEAEKQVANIRVRNVATIGGNLASGEPLTDLAQILIALDGKVKIISNSGERVVALDDFFVDYYQTALAEDEILTQVIIPPLPAHSGIDYIRFSSSSVVDKPSVGVCVKLTLDGAVCKAARIVLGCVGATPLRARKGEELLVGKKVDAGSIEQAAQSAALECKPISDIRGSEKYKRGVVRALTKRAANAALEKALA
jgi:carbon-monoxide dehydrogenase medium subunit